MHLLKLLSWENTSQEESVFYAIYYIALNGDKCNPAPIQPSDYTKIYLHYFAYN